MTNDLQDLLLSFAALFRSFTVDLSFDQEFWLLRGDIGLIFFFLQKEKNLFQSPKSLPKFPF